MSLERQRDVSHGAAIAADCLVHTFRLNRKRTLIVVGFSVDQKYRLVDLVRKDKGRHFDVHLRCFPECASLALKTERRQGAVISAAARNAGAKQIRMRQQVRSHEGAIAVPAHPDAFRISHA